VWRPSSSRRPYRFLVPPGEPTVLADRFAACCSTLAGRRVIGTQASEVRENFPVDRTVAAIAEIYDELLPPHQLTRSGP
jgi:hypothetical protein